MKINYFLLFGIVLILGTSSMENTYAPSPPTPPSQANLSITTEINSNTISDGLIIQNQKILENLLHLLKNFMINFF